MKVLQYQANIDIGRYGTMKEVRVTIGNIVNQGALCYNVSKVYLFMKRLFDLIVSFLLLLVLSPVLLAAAAAAKFQSSGPIILAQERYGYRGKKFRILAFRALLSDKNSMIGGNAFGSRTGLTGPQFEEISRLTRTGRFIRRFHIGKWLQLLNVLKGDMSLVGTHAPKPDEAESHAAWYGLVLSAKPGFTGLWYAGTGKEANLEEMVRLDLKYIRERSFLYDIKILARSCRIYLKAVCKL